MVYTLASGASGGDSVEVQVLFAAPADFLLHVVEILTGSGPIRDGQVG